MIYHDVTACGFLKHVDYVNVISLWNESAVYCDVGLLTEAASKINRVKVKVNDLSYVLEMC